MIINEAFDIPEDNPFANDKLDRELIADNLEKIIASMNGSLVLSIDAGWGNGKTTFINMWRKKLDGAGNYRTLYFNAWENDDCEDSLLALIGEIEEVLVKDKTNNSTLEKIKKCGKPLLKKALPTILKMATNGIVDIEGVNLGISNEKHLVDFAGKLGEFELYKEQKLSKAKFKEALGEFQKNEDKKIIFFIDELDRCRPTFAIETLERIKHLFNIDNFVFVLAIDKNQLSHSIKTLYGQDMDSVGYLRRFIDLELLLPEPNRAIYVDMLLTKYNFKNKKKQFEYYLKASIEYYDLTLRDIEKLFLCLRLILPTTHLFDNKEYTHIYNEVLGVVYAVFPVIKIKEFELYQKFAKREIIRESISLSKLPVENKRGSYYHSIISMIIALNNALRTRNPNEAHKVYQVGEQDDYYAFNLVSLLDETQSEFTFIKQIQFIENFVSNES